jgi:hypothetical protein
MKSFFNLEKSVPYLTWSAILVSYFEKVFRCQIENNIFYFLHHDIYFDGVLNLMLYMLIFFVNFVKGSLWLRTKLKLTTIWNGWVLQSLLLKSSKRRKIMGLSLSAWTTALAPSRAPREAHPIPLRASSGPPSATAALDTIQRAAPSARPRHEGPHPSVSLPSSPPPPPVDLPPWTVSARGEDRNWSPSTSSLRSPTSRPPPFPGGPPPAAGRPPTLCH